MSGGQQNVSPIFNKGNKGSSENYRPVSLTSQVCNLFEHMDSGNGRSCLSNLLVFLDKVTKCIDNGNPIWIREGV